MQTPWLKSGCRKSIETPHPYVCRTCGHLVLKEPSVNCPVCNARPQTFKKFLPVYWLDALDPFDVLERLRQTPQGAAALMEGLTEGDMNQVPEDGGWNIRNAVSHLRDAQGVMEFRINLMIDQDNPKLESKAVFEWAAEKMICPISRPSSGNLWMIFNRKFLKLVQLRRTWTCQCRERQDAGSGFLRICSIKSSNLTHKDVGNAGSVRNMNRPTQI